VPLPAPQDGVVAEQFDGDGAYDAALAWFTAENRVLHNVISMAVGNGDDEHCWKLAWFWAPVLKRRGRLNAVLLVQRMALDAADRLGEASALAHVHYDLGHVSGRLGDFATGESYLRRALEFYTGHDEPAGIGQARHLLGVLLHQQGRDAEALPHALEALRLRRALAGRAAVAYSENLVGFVQAHLGRHDAALRHCGLALDMHTESGSRSGIADTLDSIAYIHGRLGDYRQAVAGYAQALELYQLIGDTDGEANSLLYLGDVQLESKDADGARVSWERALALLAQIPGADTTGARARIRRLETDTAACADPGGQGPGDTGKGPAAGMIGRMQVL
jgi:tetratricopeptide (TPR) repeat protein